MVYFIQSGDNGPIKIGISHNPKSRLTELQTAHHDKLRILKVVDGDERREGGLHSKFEKYRLNGEWFKNDPELLSYIHTANKEDPYKNAANNDVPGIKVSAIAGSFRTSLKTILDFISKNGFKEDVVIRKKEFYLPLAIGHEVARKYREYKREAIRTNHRDKDKDTITIKLSEYKELLQEVGHYKGQLEGQTRNLLENKSVIVDKDKALVEAKEVIVKKERELSEAEKMLAAKNKIMQQAGEKIKELEAELNRARLPFWKRWLRHNKP
jgi:hypothetical protein